MERKPPSRRNVVHRYNRNRNRKKVQAFRCSCVTENHPGKKLVAGERGAIVEELGSGTYEVEFILGQNPRSLERGFLLGSGLKEVLELCLEEFRGQLDDLPRFVGVQQLEIAL